MAGKLRLETLGSLLADAATVGRAPPRRHATPPPPPHHHHCHLRHRADHAVGSQNAFAAVPLPDGRACVANHERGALDVLCTATGRLLRALPQLPRRVGADATSPPPRPVALALGEAHLFVGSSGDGLVHVLNLEGEPVHTLGDGELGSPYGLCLSTDGAALYVSDAERDRVLRFSTRDGAGARSTLVMGHAGAAHGELDDPRGIAHHAGTLYVADMGNHRLALFDAGTGQPRAPWPPHHRLRHPAGVAILRELLLVSEYTSGCLRVFSLGGDALQSIVPPGAGLLCAVGASGSVALVPDTLGRLHVFELLASASRRGGGGAAVDGERATPSATPARGGQALEPAVAAGVGGGRAPTRQGRIERALNAPTLARLYGALSPEDIHAILPAAYADAAANPRAYGLSDVKGAPLATPEGAGQRR